MFKGLESAWAGTTSVEDAVNQAQATVENGLGDQIIIR